MSPPRTSMLRRGGQAAPRRCGPGHGEGGRRGGETSLFRPKVREASRAATHCLQRDDDLNASSMSPPTTCF